MAGSASSISHSSSVSLVGLVQVWFTLIISHSVAGLAVSFIAFWVICNISPPPGVGVGINYHDKSRSLFAGPPIRTERLDNGEEEGTEKMMVSV
jgi:hypothetical protein